MAKQTINQGTAPTGAGGDTFRSGSAKLQANDDELYAHLGADDGSLTAAKTRTALGLGTAATAALTTSNIDAAIGRVLKVGDFGVGTPIARSSFTEEISRSGFYRTINPNPTGTPNGYMGAAVSLSNYMDYTADIYLSTFSANGSILSAPRLHFRNGSKGGWIEVRSSANTSVDANGFIKAASPIVKLFSNEIELNDEAQLQDIAFEKLGVGDYLIKGSSGFAQEGWYIETPKDANGNVLFSVIYTTLENGDISVKTYKKKFDFETVSIVADLDNPVDITENRWIDLRLQELPQPEIEMPESIALPDFQPTGLAEAVAIVMESYNDTEQ